MQDRSFQLVVQLLTLIHPGVHDVVQEDDEGEDDDEGDGKVGIKETNDDDLNKNHMNENIFLKSSYNLEENQLGVLTNTLQKEWYLSVH